MITEEQIRETLGQVKYPGYSRDIVSFGIVKGIRLAENTVTVTLEVATPNSEIAQEIKTACEQALSTVSGLSKAVVQLQSAGGQSAAGAQQQPQGPAGIGKLIAIASGKGGVGKSTVSVNLACALQRLGMSIGLLDCDIYGPSIPLMMGVSGKPMISPEEKLVPPSNYGVKLMSMGFLVEGDSPVIWRGPMIMKTVQQFIHAVDWGELDALLIDLPPGTGDAQLSLCQTVPLDGGVVVTTPQEASVGVVRKGIGMFQKLNVPILGIVENMSFFTTPEGERIEIFGHAGGRNEALRQNIPFLGEVPLYPEIRIGGDAGHPVVVSDPDSAPAEAFFKIARELRTMVYPGQAG